MTEQTPGVGDESVAPPLSEPERIDQERRWIRARARDAEAARSRALAITLAVLALAVAAISSRSRPVELSRGRQYDRLSGVLLEGVFFLVAFVTMQVSAGRLVQGRLARDDHPSPQLRPGSGPGSRPGTDAESRQPPRRRGLHPWGWIPILGPALLFLGIVLSCRIDLRNAEGGPQLYATSRSQPLVAMWVLAALTTVLVVVTVRLCQLTRSLRRPALDPPEGKESETRTLPARSLTSVRASAVAGDQRRLVLAFSGGGLRSASFCLGGFNALQELGKAGDVDAVVAVSGGGYAASAIALTRTFVTSEPPAGASPAEPAAVPSLDDVWSVSSPEMAYLRRNSRYIFQPVWRTISGLWQLLGGAAINIFLAVMALRFFAWLLGWYWSAAGLVTGLDTAHPQLNLHAWRDWQWWGTTFLWILAVALIGLLLFRQILRRGSDKKMPSADAWARQLATASRALFVTVMVMVLLPAVLAGVSRVAYNNQPTRLVAKAVVSLGLTNSRACDDAIRRSADSAHRSAMRRAGLTQQAETATYGACGSEGTLRYDPAKPDGYDGQAAVDAVGGAPTKQGISGQLTSVFLVVAAALGALRRAFTSVGKSSTGRFAPVRRWLLMRLPLVAISLLALWLEILWAYQYLISGPTKSGLVVPLLLAVWVVAQLLNPNLTSLHEFYRERLSSAFAVGRDKKNRELARNLPYDQRYLLSQLAPGPELVLCTTANINDQRVVPTRRFGVPMTFSQTAVELATAGLDPALGRQPTAAVEADVGGPPLTVMGASAMSGAAVSPMMGRMGGKVAPFRLLLTLFNVRLGVWMMNPRWPLDEPPAPAWAPMATQPRLHQLFSEAFGATAVDDRWIYLTDGGHLDNLGLVEAVRRMPDRVVALSASNDAPGTWQDVGAAVSVLRADLGVELRVVRRDIEDTWMRLLGVRPDGRRIEILVVKASLTSADWPVVGTPAGTAFPAVTQRMPIDIRSFATRDATFPRTSTGRQDFGDLEFESYRHLGEFLLQRALRQNPSFL